MYMYMHNRAVSLGGDLDYNYNYNHYRSFCLTVQSEMEVVELKLPPGKLGMFMSC